MSHTFNQSSLVIAIVNELCKQHASAQVSTRQMNAICAAATTICESMASDDIPSQPKEGLQRWLGGHDTGVSSLTMAAVMFSAGNYVGNPHRYSHPHDSSDFGRCHRFLEAVPGSRDKLHLMAAVSPTWAKLVENWDTITALYVEEASANQIPYKAHKLITSIVR